MFSESEIVKLGFNSVRQYFSNCDLIDLSLKSDLFVGNAIDQRRALLNVKS